MEEIRLEIASRKIFCTSSGVWATPVPTERP